MLTLITWAALALFPVGVIIESHAIATGREGTTLEGIGRGITTASLVMIPLTLVALNLTGAA